MAPRVALMLPGGGARGAYQVGAVRALWELAGGQSNPFPVMVGASAGAINAGVLASHAHEFGHGLQRLEHFWSQMACHHIYRTDWVSVLRSAGHWLGSMLLGRLGFPGPESLLDTEPLRHLLDRETRLGGIARAIESGALDALAVTASGYTSSRAVTFFQAASGWPGWSRGRRLGRQGTIQVDHLMASAALPLLFPAIQVGNEFYGDGGLRQTAPLSPAIHLGADRILVVTTRDEHPDPEPQVQTERPSTGEIAGHMLDIVFMDNLQADLDRLQRVNHTVSLIDPARRHLSDLRAIDTLVIRPSRDVRHIADEFMDRVPASVKVLLAGMGAWRKGTRLPSYLLFESEYCQSLMELGYQDAMDQRAGVERMFSG